MKKDALQPYISTINKLGRTPRGFLRSEHSPEAIFKAIFKNSKKTVLEIWEIYTQRREDLSRKLVNNKEAVMAYLFGFHLANMARAHELYERSDKLHGWRKKLTGKNIRIYDIGCGTAAMSLALGIEGDYILIDSSGPLLDVANILAKAHGIKAKTSRRNIEDLDLKQFRPTDKKNTVNIYLLGYVWNELVRNAPARRKILSVFKQHLKNDESCLLFIAEPALDFMSRPAMTLRDELCQMGFIAMYPCPNSAPCPMLERTKDWCYSEGQWSQPPLAKWIDEQLDINRSKHASTLFALSSPALAVKPHEQAVVVGRPVRDSGKDRYKGFFDYLICENGELRKETPQRPKQVISRGQLFKE